MSLDASNHRFKIQTFGAHSCSNIISIIVCCKHITDIMSDLISIHSGPSTPEKASAPSHHRIGKTPMTAASSKAQFQAVVKYANTREAKYDDWGYNHMRTPEMIQSLLGDSDLDDFDEDFSYIFNLATTIRRHRVKPIHIIRCLDPTKEAYDDDALLTTETHGLSTRRGVQYRHTLSLQSWHLEKYADFLNWVSHQHQKDYFYCFHVLDKPLKSQDQDSFDVSPNKKYNARKYRYFEYLTLLNLLKRYDCVGVPVNLSEIHWTGVLIEKDKEARMGTHFHVYCYCSLGGYEETVAFIKPWLAQQLGDRKLTFHKAQCPIQEDPTSCGTRLMLVFQLCMFKYQAPMKVVTYDEQMVIPFRYRMLSRILDHEAE